MNNPYNIPEGYDLLRIGYPKPDEWYVGAGMVPVQLTKTTSFTTPVAVVEPKLQWTKLKCGHWDGIPVLARFRQHPSDPWVYGTLVANTRSATPWKHADGLWYRYCEVRKELHD